jgi:hypothetical protein
MAASFSIRDFPPQGKYFPVTDAISLRIAAALILHAITIHLRHFDPDWD